MLWHTPIRRSLDFTKCRWVAAESSIDDVRPRFSKANDKLCTTRDAYVAGACTHTAARNGRVSSAVLGAYMYPNATTLMVPLELNSAFARQRSVGAVNQSSALLQRERRQLLGIKVLVKVRFRPQQCPRVSNLNPHFLK